MAGVFGPEYEVFWSAVGAMAQTVIALAALVYSVATFRSSTSITHYSEIDSTYHQLLAMALERPHLVQVEAMRSDDQRAEYAIYAFMVWNFLEAIYDRCNSDRHLRETWFPIIKAESQLHRGWFEDPANGPRFKESFRNYIACSYPLPVQMTATA